jgi:hypothetical protein
MYVNKTVHFLILTCILHVSLILSLFIEKVFLLNCFLYKSVALTLLKTFFAFKLENKQICPADLQQY